MSTLRERIIETARRFGADEVGFAPVSRFGDDAVTRIFPGTKTVIGLSFRVLRGSLRGVEEGSTYYQYCTTGLETIEETVMPMALLRASAVIEDEGYLAVPQKKNQLIMAAEDDTNPEMSYDSIYRGVTAETQLDFSKCAVLCGLGEPGLNGSVLTERNGPFQRFGFILTDAELEPTALIEPHLCDNCGKCIAACPGHALAADGSRSNWQCAAYYMGAAKAKNPFMPPEAYEGMADREAIMRGEKTLEPEEAREVIDNTYFYPPIKHGYVASICGRACDRACYVHLEESGKLRNAFTSPMRKRPDWKLED